MINLGKLPDGEYMYASHDETQDGKRKTPVYVVYEKNTCARLGELKWYGAWRAYCFFTFHGMVFDDGCMLQIIKWMNELNRRYKEARRS